MRINDSEGTSPAASYIHVPRVRARTVNDRTMTLAVLQANFELLLVTIYAQR